MEIHQTGIALSCAAILIWGCTEGSHGLEPLSTGEGLERNGSRISLSNSFRLPQGCGEGFLPMWDLASEAWDCAPAPAPALRPGIGLLRDGERLGLAPAYRFPQGCPDGSVPRLDEGSWLCWTPPTENKQWEFVPGPARVIHVGTEGADWYQNGEHLRAALDEARKRILETVIVSDGFWYYQPYVVKLAPGRYQTGPLYVPDLVILEGAGIRETLLHGTGADPVLRISGHAVLRHLGVRGGKVGLRIESPWANVWLEHVSIEGTVGLESTAGSDNHGDPMLSLQGEALGARLPTPSLHIRYSSFRGSRHAVVMSSDGSSWLKGATLKDSQLDGGLLVERGELSVENVTLRRFEGPAFTLGESAEVKVHGSRVSGTALLLREAEDASLRIAGSEVSVEEVGDTLVRCVHSYDGDFEALGQNCQPLAGSAEAP